MNANITKRMTTFSLDEIPIAFSAYTLCDRIQYSRQHQNATLEHVIHYKLAKLGFQGCKLLRLTLRVIDLSPNYRSASVSVRFTDGRGNRFGRTVFDLYFFDGC